MVENNIVDGEILDEATLTLEEFAHACAVERQWVKERVESGMLGSSRPNLTPGLDVTWSGFSSTASTINVMTAFLGQEGERIMYDIELTEPLARDIRPFSVYPSENELLLPPGFSFEIVATFSAGGGLTMVQCKQTETLDVLLDFGTLSN